MAGRLAYLPTAFANDPSTKDQKRVEDPQHLAFIRKLPSAVSGLYGCEACHIRSGNPDYRKKRTGKGQKPDDWWTVPLTPEEHREQHNMNEMAFWRRYGIDPFALAKELYAVTGEFDQAHTILGRNR